jgi:hypothetical protein
VRQVQPGADLPVGQPLHGQPDDLQFLRRQLRPGVGLALAGSPAGGGEFLYRPCRPGGGAERIEDRLRGLERPARFGDPPTPAQP